MLQKQSQDILQEIASYLECEEYGKLFVCCRQTQKALEENLDSKKPIYHFYGNSYGPRTFAEIAFPSKYEHHINNQEYDGADDPVVDLNSYIVDQVSLIDITDIENVSKMKKIISKLQKAEHNLEKELIYFPKIHLRNQKRSINIKNKKGKRNDEFWEE